VIQVLDNVSGVLGINRSLTMVENAPDKQYNMYLSMNNVKRLYHSLEAYLPTTQIK